MEKKQANFEAGLFTCGKKIVLWTRPDGIRVEGPA